MVKKLSKEWEGMKNPIGRPRKWTDPVAFDAAVDEYFLQCEEKGTRPLLTGMLVHLGIYSKETFYRYGEKHPEFRDSVKRARMFIEMTYENLLMKGNGTQAGVIFALKNFNWKDKTEVDQVTTHTFGDRSEEELQNRLKQLREKNDID